MPKHTDKAAASTVIVPNDATTYPPVGQVVLATLKHHKPTIKTQEVEMVRVKEDDVSWRTADDRSELSYSWSVISWRLPTASSA